MKIRFESFRFPDFNSSNNLIKHHLVHIMGQRRPNTGMRATRGPRTIFLRPANAFCVPHITQSHNYIVLATQPLQVTHH